MLIPSLLLLGIALGIITIFISGAMFVNPRCEFHAVIITMLIGVTITIVCTDKLVIHERKTSTVTQTSNHTNYTQTINK